MLNEACADGSRAVNFLEFMQATLKEFADSMNQGHHSMLLPVVDRSGERDWSLGDARRWWWSGVTQ